MNNETALLTKQENSNPEYVRVEAMAYRHGMTVEQYAIALATKAELPKAKTDEEIFAEIRSELEDIRGKAENETVTNRGYRRCWRKPSHQTYPSVRRRSFPALLGQTG